jgi:hypothetical protein
MPNAGFEMDHVIAMASRCAWTGPVGATHRAALSELRSIGEARDEEKARGKSLAFNPPTPNPAVIAGPAR